MIIHSAALNNWQTNVTKTFFFSKEAITMWPVGSLISIEDFYLRHLWLLLIPNSRSFILSFSFAGYWAQLPRHSTSQPATQAAFHRATWPLNTKVEQEHLGTRSNLKYVSPSMLQVVMCYHYGSHIKLIRCWPILYYSFASSFAFCSICWPLFLFWVCLVSVLIFSS